MRIVQLLGLAAPFAAGIAAAQTDAEAPLYWAYGAYFGTGRYELDAADTLDEVYTLSVRPSRSWGEPH